jgi:hypothetical protein
MGERVRVRGDRTQCIDDAFQNSVDVSKHIGVPKAQNQITLRFELGGSLRICFAMFDVLSTIKLDDQASSFTAEIYDIPANRHLSPKLQPIEPAIAQAEPQFAFRVSLLAPKLASYCHTQRHNPSPARASRGHPLP